MIKTKYTLYMWTCPSAIEKLQEVIQSPNYRNLATN